MHGEFDATFKSLFEKYPGIWAYLFRLNVAGEIRVVDADLSTIAAEADKVFWIVGPPAFIMAVEAQANYDPDLPVRMCHYSVTLLRRHGLPVTSGVILLRPEADGPNMTGVLTLTGGGGEPSVQFWYHVVRLWKLSADSLLAGPLGALPLALLTDDARPRLAEVGRKLVRRVEAEAPPTERDTILTATYILSGLRYSPDVANEVLAGVQHMKESTTYQYILSKGLAEGEARGLEKGRLATAREMLLMLGARRFGQPSRAVRTKIEAEQDFARLEAWTGRVLDAANWQELIAS